MRLHKVLGRRRKRVKPTDFARHARKCCICKHKDRASIEQDFLRWRSPEAIVRAYGLGHRSALYRHAAATGLSAERCQGYRSALEFIMEQVENTPITASVIVRAVGAYAHLHSEGRRAEPRKRGIVKRVEESTVSHPRSFVPPHPSSLIATTELKNAATR